MEVLGKPLNLWSMVLVSQLTSGAVFGENRWDAGYRTPHLKSVCSLSCCWVLCWEQDFYTIFLYAFCKMVLFCTRKKLLGNFKKIKFKAKQNLPHLTCSFFWGGGIFAFL